LTYVKPYLRININEKNGSNIMNDLSNLDQIPSNIDDYENGGAAHPGHLVDSAPLEGGVNLDVEASQEISSVPKSRRGRRQRGKQANRDESQ